MEKENTNKMWCLNRFCCCGSMRTGTFILGITELIFSALFLCISFGNIVEFDRASSLLQGVSHFGRYDASYFHFGYGLISTIIYGLTIHGASKKKSRLLLPYLILNGILLCISIVFLLVIIGLVSAAWDRIQISVLIITAFTFFIITTVVKIYFWLTVFSYYHEIREEKSKIYSNSSTCCSVETNGIKYTVNEQTMLV